MIFKRLIVFCKMTDSIIKEYFFKTSGVNVILGEKREQDNETNGVGKTTMIDCLSFLLGKNISNQYINSPQLLVKDIYIFLEIKKGDKTIFLCRTFNNPKVGYSLENENLDFSLDNWEKYSTVAKYKVFIEKIISPTLPIDLSFASIREFIIRNEKTGYNDIIISNRSSSQQYKILNYLFDLPYNTELEIKSRKNEQNELSAKVKLIETLTQNISDLKMLENKILEEIKYIDSQIKSTATIEHYNNNVSIYNQKKTYLNKIQKQIFEIEHIKKQYNRNIENLNSKLDEINKISNLEEFYKELVGYFPGNIKKNFSEIQQFYSFMVQSRGSFFTEKISKFELDLQNFKQEAQTIKDDLEKLSKIINSENFIQDLSSIMESKRSKEIQLAQIQLRLSDYEKRNEINAQINSIQQEIIRITEVKNEEFQALTEHIKSLQLIFRNLTYKTYKQNGYLEVEFNNQVSNRKDSTTGRIKIGCSIPDENSHGRLHMKINMFDLTGLIFRVINKLDINFLIHDGSYSNPDPYVKGILLKYVNEILEEYSDGQYFVTLNKTELLQDDLDYLDSNNCICAKLDKLNNDQNRFFGFKFS